MAIKSEGWHCNMNENKEERKVSKIVRYGSYTMLAFILLGNFIITYFERLSYPYMYEGAEASGAALGATIPMVIGALIAVYCANKNSEWALKIGKSLNFAFLVGIFSGLLGLLWYGIYYKTKGNRIYLVVTIIPFILFWIGFQLFMLFL